MKIMFLVLALVLATVNGGLLLQDDEVDDALLAVDEPDDADQVDDALLPVDDKDDADEVDDSMLAVDDTDEVDDALAPVDALENRRLEDKNLKGNLVKLGKYYPKGIPVSVLFSFDTTFISMFGNKGMDTLIALVKKHYQDKSLKNGIGTTINVTGAKRKFSRTFKYTRPGTGDFPENLQKDATKISTTLKKTYDAYLYVMGESTNGGGGVSIAGTVCNAQVKQRIGMVMGPQKTDSECSNGCTNSVRMSVMGKTAAHELGHILGMDHDFDTKAYNAGLRKRQRIYNYRKYNGKSCKGGLMSYAPPRSGWSLCGQRDMSRYLTSGGTKKPCTFASKIKGSGGCSAACLSNFKRCVGHTKVYGCSRGYTICREDLDNGQLGSACTKKCKAPKKMLALKSSC